MSVARGAQLELDFDATPNAATPTTASGVRAIRLGPQIIPYRFRRARRRTIGLTIDRDGLVAAAPRWVPLAEVEAFIREKRDWILRKLAERPLEVARRFAWQDGERLPYLDGELTLRFSASVARPTLEDGMLLVPARVAQHADPAAKLRATVLPWIHAAGLAHFGVRIATLAPRAEVAPPPLTLSNARTQWGSCTIGRDRQPRIRLHWKLVLLPAALGDYVVAHELAHVREMNHSERFWQLVETICPDYRSARRLLRNEAKLLPDL